MAGWQATRFLNSIHRKSFERDAIARDGMSDRAERFERFGRETQNGFGQVDHFGFGLRKFDIGKFPEMRVDHISRSLANQKTSFMFHNKRSEPAFRDLHAFSEIGKIFHPIELTRATMFYDGTNQTLRRTGRADQSAKFHQRLI